VRKDWEVLVHALMHRDCALYVIETLFVFTNYASYLKRRLDMAECGCGRSPTGKCVGWHGLTEEQYQEKKAAYEAKQASKSAAE
jgi:hypothetical protein